MPIKSDRLWARHIEKRVAMALTTRRLPRKSLGCIAMAFSLLALGIANPATAQQASFTEIQTDAGKDWEHKGSGITVPVQIDGVARQNVRQLGTTQTDILISYQDKATGTTTSIYIFHAAAPSVPLWFDTARYAITVGNYFGTLTPLADEAPLVLPGSEAPMGLRSVYTASAPNFKSTGLALAGAKDWIVKIRMSSTQLTAEQLDTQIGKTLAALNLPASAAGTSMVAVKPCASALSFPKPAKKRKSDMGDALLGGMLGAIADVGPAANADGAAPSVSPMAVFCRDPSSKEFPVYRANESTDSYILVMGDAGRAVMVNPQLDLTTKDGRADDSNFAVRGVLPDRSFTFPSFDALPSPMQLAEHVRNERPISVSITAGPKAGTIEIITP